MLFDMKQNVLQGLLTQKKLLTLGWERAILTCPKQIVKLSNSPLSKELLSPSTYPTNIFAKPLA